MVIQLPRHHLTTCLLGLQIRIEYMHARGTKTPLIKSSLPLFSLHLQGVHFLLSLPITHYPLPPITLLSLSLLTFSHTQVSLSRQSSLALFVFVLCPFLFLSFPRPPRNTTNILLPYHIWSLSLSLSHYVCFL